MDFLPLIGSAVSGLFGMSATQSNNQANMELAKYQNEQNIKLWQMQNEYNLPKNQMQRYIDAGLNPNLMYGQGNPGNASAPPSTNVPTLERYQVPDFGQAAAQSVNLINQAHQLDLKDSEVQNQNHVRFAQALKLLSEVPGVKAKSAMAALQHQFFKDVYDNKVTQVELQTSILQVQDSVAQMNANYMPDKLKLNLKTFEQQLINLMTDQRKTLSQIVLFAKQGRVQDAMVSRIMSQNKVDKYKAVQMYGSFLKTLTDIRLGVSKFTLQPYSGKYGQMLSGLGSLMNGLTTGDPHLDSYLEDLPVDFDSGFNAVSDLDF